MSHNTPPPNRQSERVAMICGAVFLFGLAGLISLDIVWPYILVLIGLTMFPIFVVEEGWRLALWVAIQSAIWLGGIPLLIALGAVWPGILVLAGVSALVVAAANPDDLSKKKVEERQKDKRKAKRDEIAALPLPDRDVDLLAVDDDDDEGDMVDFWGEGEADDYFTENRQS